MKILIIKTSSLGDVIQTLPALTDAGIFFSEIKFDWVVEEAFQDIPKLHPLVDKVIPVAIRRWRKRPFSIWFSKEWREFRKQIKAQKYDYVIDAQGLLKSALITKMASGKKVGLDKESLTESVARFFYDTHVNIDLQKHAIFRMRTIFAKALGYEFDSEKIDYGINVTADETRANYVMFMHGTTWSSKHWPDKKWLKLAEKIAKESKIKILLPQINSVEENRAGIIAQNCDLAIALPKMDLLSLAKIIKGAKKIIAVDSGLAHLAAALGVPCATLYGPTSPNRIGTKGNNQIHIISNNNCIGCMKKVCKFNNEFSQCMDKIDHEIL